MAEREVVERDASEQPGHHGGRGRQRRSEPGVGGVGGVSRGGGLSRPRVSRLDVSRKFDLSRPGSFALRLGELPDSVQINAGTEMLEGEEFGDDNFDFDEDAAEEDIRDL